MRISRSGVFDGLMYLSTVGAVLAATVAILLVAIAVGTSIGVAGFLGSLLLFPLTWLVGSPMLALGSGDWSAAAWLGLSLLLASPPVLLTMRARRRRKAQRVPGMRSSQRARQRPPAERPPAPYGSPGRP